MDDPYVVMCVAMRQGMINNLKLCWAGASRTDTETMDKLANSIADVLLELSAETDDNATTAIYDDAKSIARDVIASSMRHASAGRLGAGRIGLAAGARA